MQNALSLMCWEGYEAPSITAPFEARHALNLEVQTLLSDAHTVEWVRQNKGAGLDVLNINNAYVRDDLDKKGLIKPLDQDRFEAYRASIHPVYEPFLPWSHNANGDLIGIGQRFGPFNLVVNTDAISMGLAQDQGFELANDPANAGRFGVLDYPDFNVFHVCFGAGLNPFSDLSADQLSRFERVARSWFSNAAIVTSDHHVLNRALLEGCIDFYVSGGTYTASPARREGYRNVSSVVPNHGPVEGKGAIAFSEITSVINRPGVSRRAEDFLAYLLEPETALNAAMTKNTCNPVAQMGDARVFGSFTREQLDIIQWDELEENLSLCCHYQIPNNIGDLLGILARIMQTK